MEVQRGKGSRNGKDRGREYGKKYGKQKEEKGR
jgi:hypothetical protein